MRSIVALERGISTVVPLIASFYAGHAGGSTMKMNKEKYFIVSRGPANGNNNETVILPKESSKSPVVQH